MRRDPRTKVTLTSVDSTISSSGAGNSGITFTSKFGALDLSRHAALASPLVELKSPLGKYSTRINSLAARSDQCRAPSAASLWRDIHHADHASLSNGSRNTRWRADSRLIEMMVATVIGMIVAAGAVGLIVAIDPARIRKPSRQHESIRNCGRLLQLIGDDIKRARRVHDPVYYVGQGGTCEWHVRLPWIPRPPAAFVFGYQDTTLAGAAGE